MGSKAPERVKQEMPARQVEVAGTRRQGACMSPVGNRETLKVPMQEQGVQVSRECLPKPPWRREGSVPAPTKMPGTWYTQ